MQAVKALQVADEKRVVFTPRTAPSQSGGEGNLNMANAAINLSASEALRAPKESSMLLKHSLMVRTSPGAPRLHRNPGVSGVDSGTARLLPLLLGSACPDPSRKSAKTSSGAPRSTR